EKVTDATLKVGWWVALVLKPDAAPLRSYAGKIQAIDERGLRIPFIDWFTGIGARFDLYVPLASLESALVATPDHDVKNFGDAAAKWQQQMERAEKKEPPN